MLVNEEYKQFERRSGNLLCDEDCCYGISQPHVGMFPFSCKDQGEP